MKLSEIVSALNELKATVSAFIGDKAKATSDAVSAFATKLSTLESGIVAELSQKTADLLTAQASISTLTAANTKLSAEATTINESLSAALASLKIEIQADASSADKISALADGVSKTLAKLNVDASKIPASNADAGTGGTDIVAQLNEISDPVKRSQFYRANAKAIKARMVKTVNK